MIRILLLGFIFFSSITYAYNQDYRTGIGFRAGPYNELTIKHFTSDRVADEGIFTGRWRGFQATGLWEVHDIAFKTPGLKWFNGFGGHIGFWHGNNTYPRWGERGESYTIIGIDGIIGLEYTFEPLPTNIGMDWRPAYHIFEWEGFWAVGSAFTIRYT